MTDELVRRRTLDIRPSALRLLIDAVHCKKPVTGSTHEFYRYPARFSPQFAEAVIETFSAPGQVVLDPFMGGATTLVEARTLGRIGIGLDVNELSCFIAHAKTTTLSTSDAELVRSWIQQTLPALNMRQTVNRPHDWIAAGYQRNVSTRQTWPIRKALELALDRVSLLDTISQQNFVRAALLRTGQWALDCRSDIPSAARFRDKLEQFLAEMIEGVMEYERVTSSLHNGSLHVTPTIILHRSAEGIDEEPAIRQYGPPTLVLTSPPYPGVHVLYHRWQILGRRETPAPFWITNTRDGNGLSYYTFGDRKSPTLQTYFDTARSAFASIARISQPNTLVVQMVAFSDASWQLPQYLRTMREAGLQEFKLSGIANREDGRLWRTVPNRKWYADQRASVGAGKEVVLFHRPSK
jgi:DNA modification methylase